MRDLFLMKIHFLGLSQRLDEYKALMKKYNQDLKIYEKELKDWEEACLKLEIEETELKLKKLKRNK